MASSAPSWSTLALTTTYIQTGSRASMDQTRELLVLVIDLNMERITPNFVSGVKVVLINWRELMAERKCLSLSLYWRCVSGMNSLASTSRNVSRVLSGCLFHRSILSQYISSDLDSLNNVGV